MNHYLNGLVAAPELLETFAAAHDLNSPVPLSQGMALLPLLDDDIYSFLDGSPAGNIDGFIYFSEQIMRILAAFSVNGMIAYVETEYSDGMGNQGAAVFADGEILFGPTAAESGPINEALRLFPVEVEAPAVDEFESVGLDRHRKTEDWLE